MPTVLITGGAGYLGQPLSHLLLKLGYDVVCVDNLFHRQETAFLCRLASDSKYRFHNVDLMDVTAIDQYLRGVDFVIHLAAIVGYQACDRYKEQARVVNLELTKRIVDRLHSDQRLIYPTTNSGYGTTDGSIKCTEETPLNPISLYGETKAKAEKYIRENLPSNGICFRLATVFGTSSRPRTDLLVNNFVWKAYKDRYNVIFDGKAMRNFVHINDVLRAFLWAMDMWDKVIAASYRNVVNFGNDSLNMSKLELARTINKLVPHEIVEGNIGEDPDKRNYIVSSDRFMSTGFKCQESLDDGILALVRQYQIIDTPRFGNY